MKIRSFRLKLLIALFGTVALLVGLTLVLMTFFVRREIVNRSARDRQKAMAAFAEQRIQRDAKLQEICSRLIGSRRLAAALEEGDPQVLLGVAQNEQEISKLQHTFMAILNRDGKTLLQMWKGTFLTPRSERETLARGLDLNTARTVGHGYFAAEGTLFEAVCQPLQTTEGTYGTVVVAFAVSDDTAKQLASSFGSDPSTGARDAEVAFLADGKVLASTLPPASRKEVEPKLRGRDDWAPIELTWRGTPYIAFTETLPPGNLSSAVMFSQASFYELLGVLRSSALICGALTLLLCVWLTEKLSRGISAPVSELAAGARQIRQGNLAVRVQPRTADEIGRLAESFNEMAEGLQLKEKYRGVLDKVVSPEVAEELLSGKINLGGELRSVTVLFCDIRGFTKMTEGMAPHEVLDLLNRHMTAMTEIVRGHGGIVDKFVGDEIMAVFGAPKSTGQDARAALAAAVEMRAARERQKAGEPPERRFDVGFGVNTGEVVAGNMGSDKQLSYTVLGKTVNLASRLCKAAPPGKILASASTIEGAGEPIRAEALESMDVKGFSEPVRVFEVRGVA